MNALATAPELSAGTPDPYRTFLESKIKRAPSSGFAVEDGEIHPLLKPHQRAIVRWALKGGRRAIFAKFGLGKSFMQLEISRLVLTRHPDGMALITMPLGVRREFMRDAEKLGIPVRFIRSDAEADAPGVYLTNHEAVVDGRVTPARFVSISLDEASVLRSYGSQTFHAYMALCEVVTFRFVATATPNPNRLKELIHYSAFLGVMDSGQALTRFFQRNSEKANDLTLYPHKQTEFWNWISSWAVVLQTPSDLCDCRCHVEKSSKDTASETSRSSPGVQALSGTEHGGAAARVAASVSQRQITCLPVELEVVAASGQSTASKALPLGALGDLCSEGLTEIGCTTPAEALRSAIGGKASQISLQTWASPHQEERSTGSITTETTSQEIAAGLPARNKRATHEETSCCHMRVGSNRSPHGQKSLESVISSSIRDTSTDGRSSECSEISCAQCSRLDEGYDLPELVVRWHEVDLPADGAVDRDGQGLLIAPEARGLAAEAKARRSSLDLRVGRVAELVAARPADHVIIWHDLEDERRAIAKAVPDVVSAWGSQDLDAREDVIIGFGDGLFPRLSTKPSIAGSGCNLQRHCHWAVFAGIGHKFNDFIQSIHRVQRFGQPHAVEVDIVHTVADRGVRRNLERKWAEHEEMGRIMGEIIRKHGLNGDAMAEVLDRSIGVARVEVAGENWRMMHNDCVEEVRAWVDNEVDLIVTSIPFSNHYEYTPSFNDFGHTEGNAQFFAQMDHLTPELLRVLRPGRIAAVHVKDRVEFGNVTGAGLPTIDPFHAECIMHYRRHGFDFCGMIHVNTDVVRENNGTYRLGYTEMLKDSTKMGVGCPEYVLLLHKPQTDKSKAYADVKVAKTREEYSLARWQIDAHAHWRSSGDRFLTPDEWAELPTGARGKLFMALTAAMAYDHEAVVRVGEELEARGLLPKVFMGLAPGSTDPMIWDDVLRMRTLNAEQSLGRREKHVCPLQLDIVDRLIVRFSMAGERVFDPFGGIGTVPSRAVALGRVGWATELNPNYVRDALGYLRAAEAKRATPTLFDAIDLVAGPPVGASAAA